MVSCCGTRKHFERNEFEYGTTYNFCLQVIASDETWMLTVEDYY